jgi:hypothetical protein
MSNRAQRRAAERQARKEAVKASKVLTATASVGSAEPPSDLPEQPPVDNFNMQDLINEIKEKNYQESRRAANRANAQHSTGPKTDEGKAKSSMNAVKTGLTGRTVLLPGDDALIYQQHLDRNFLEFAPGSDREHALVQTIADAEWRLLRIHPLEASLWALGLREFAAEFADVEDETNRQALLNGKILRDYKKDFSNLALQERRLRNHRKEDIAELKQLQQQRIDKENERLAQEKFEASPEHRNREYKRAISMSSKTHRKGLDFDPRQFGFDFSDDEIWAFDAARMAHHEFASDDLDFPTWLADYRAAQKAA